MSEEVGRFAPSTTGDAHPGTLLAALLAWLDMRARGGRIVLRLEDLDHTRVTEAYRTIMPVALRWLGLEWDVTIAQRDRAQQHAAALDTLADMGVLYSCTCSRTVLRRHGVRAPDGGFAYANTCRGTPLPKGGWRRAVTNVRARLPDTQVRVIDESGVDLSQTPSRDMGDPVVFRKDGVVAYQLAVVVDDADAGVTRVVRGRDIAPSTATQIALQRLLGLPIPTYRHHLLLLEPHGDKLAKLHASVGYAEVSRHYSGQDFCGWLAHLAGLANDASPTTPQHLVATFAWSRVVTHDIPVVWNGSGLQAF